MRILAASLSCALALAAPAAADGVEVDLELVLLVDVSRSMTDRELEIQRRGYAAALDSDAILAALQTGLLRRIAMTYIEWAGDQNVVVDWRLVETRDDLAAFADTLTGEAPAGDESGPGLRGTSISGALGFAVDAIGSNGFEGPRRVIDISGDGPNNMGPPVTAARDAALAEGIVINGLPIMARQQQAEMWTAGLEERWRFEGLDVYYGSCVIGGPGAFLIPVLSWDDFASAIRRKLELEMVWDAGAAAVIPADYVVPSYDCLIGR